MPAKTSKIKLDGAFAKGDQAKRRSGLLPGGWWLWCLVGLALGLGVWMGGRRYLRTELTGQLTSDQSGREALASIDALMRLDGDAAIDVARALAHPDFTVAHAAFRSLNDQVDAWGQLESAERSSRMTELVGQLESVPRNCDQDHRILVIGLASRLYAEALSSRDATAGDVLDRCKRIMDRRTSSRDAGEILASMESSLSDSDPGSLGPATLPPIESGSSAADALSDHSAAATQASLIAQPKQPPSPSEMPRLSSNQADRNDGEPASSPSATPRVHLTGASSRQATLVERPAGLTLRDPDGNMPFDVASAEESQDPKLHVARPFDADGAEAPASDRAQAAHDLSPSREPHASNEERRAEEATLAGIDQLPIDQLVRLLSSVQPRVSQAASLALRRKGMSDDKLDLAMQLAVGTAAERSDLLTSLGQRSDLDPRPWLLWMASDGEEAVREQAVGMLAPLLDQEVRRQLRLLLTKERDERVAQTIRRVLLKRGQDSF